MTASVNPMDLSGRTVIVTGAAQGIGHAISRLCTDLGANVILADANSAALEAALPDFPPDQTRAACGDVTRDSFAAHCVQLGIDTFGASAPADQLYKHFGITVEAVVDAARGQLKG